MQKEAQATRVLQSCGAIELESAEGEWREGRWIDFDPVAPPAPLRAPARKRSVRRRTRA